MPPIPFVLGEFTCTEARWTLDEKRKPQQIVTLTPTVLASGGGSALVVVVAGHSFVPGEIVELQALTKPL